MRTPVAPKQNKKPAAHQRARSALEVRGQGAVLELELRLLEHQVPPALAVPVQAGLVGRAAVLAVAAGLAARAVALGLAQLRTATQTQYT